MGERGGGGERGAERAGKKKGERDWNDGKEKREGRQRGRGEGTDRRERGGREGQTHIQSSFGFAIYLQIYLQHVLDVAQTFI